MVGLSRVIKQKHDSISRIIKFGKDAEAILDSSSCDTPAGLAASLDGKENSIDYDSCISPSFGITKSHSLPSERMRLLLLNGGYEGRNLSVDSTVETHDSVDDFDSCLSPISTPRWTVDALDRVKRSESSVSFAEMHCLLNEGFITHFSASPREGGKSLAIVPEVKPRTVIISGSFNPLHTGHESLARRAIREATDASGEYFFEISTVNVDKGAISAEEMERRVDYIVSRGHCCLLTNAILFDAKSELFPKCIFAIGFDTYVRVINPKYYPRVTGGIDGTMARVEANGCEFFVGGRLTEGVFRTLAPSPRVSTSARNTPSVMLSDALEFQLQEETPPENFRFRRSKTCYDSVDFGNEEPMSPIFSGISNFRHDISSTEIRLRGIPSD